MSIFAVMHIFAFPWKPYSIKHSYSDPLYQPRGSYSDGGEPTKYQGGRFGLLALADAFNPWDIIKMTARGFRWLFVGVRHRHDDVSYQNGSKKNPAYQPATELRPTGANGVARVDGAAEDDRAGLLRHSGQMPRATPYRPNSNDGYAAGEDSQIDLGRPQQHQSGTHGTSSYGLDMKPSEFPDDDTLYPAGSGLGSFAASGAGAGAGGLTGGSVHPAFRISGQRRDHDVFGEPAQTRGDADSIRSPTYRTHDYR